METLHAFTLQIGTTLLFKHKTQILSKIYYFTSKSESGCDKNTHTSQNVLQNLYEQVYWIQKSKNISTICQEGGNAQKYAL